MKHVYKGARIGFMFKFGKQSTIHIIANCQIPDVTDVEFKSKLQLKDL